MSKLTALSVGFGKARETMVYMGTITVLMLTVLLCVLNTHGIAYCQPIDGYKRFVALTCISKKDTAVILREFYLNGNKKYLIVNPTTLATSIIPGDSAAVKSVSWDLIARLLHNSVYVKSLREAEKNSDTVQDAGITHFTKIRRGIDLTIDLCPSKRALDREFFTQLVAELGNVEKPVPLAISITGIWMKEHTDDLAWLKKMVEQKAITVTWINHSYNHRNSETLPLRKNFLLETGTDLSFEILQTEKKMIENGLLPSIFFRFPGLVSDDSIFVRVTDFGLIPIGSDAWLGKGQWPKDGSIVLVHANGNEPLGINRFLTLLREEKEKILNNNWQLFDLRESIEEQETIKR